MKKLITLLLLLVGGVSLVSAKTATIYVKAEAAPNLWAWESSDINIHLYGSDWPGNTMSETEPIGGSTFYKAELNYTDAFSIVFSDNKSNQTADISNLSGDVFYFTYDKNNIDKYANYNNISTLNFDFCYDLGNWEASPLTLTMSDTPFTWTGTLDLSKTLADQKFKFRVKNDWFGTNSSDVTLGATNLVDQTGSDDYSFILLNSNKTYQTYIITATWTPSINPSTGWNVTIVGGDARQFASINSVGISGSFKSTNPDTWNSISLTETGAGTYTYTGTIDLTGWTDNKQFKLVVNGGGDASDNWAGWIGCRNSNLSIVAPTGWVTDGQNTDNGNLQLNHASTGYATYNVTATWNRELNYYEGWTLTIEGATKKSYTVTFVNTEGWSEVAAWAWSGTEGQSDYVNYSGGTWPGTQLSKTGESDDVYTFTLEGYNSAPEYIIFNNNQAENASQTATFGFVNGAQYTASSATVKAKIGASGFTTFCSAQILDFTDYADATAYIASAIEGKTVTFTKVTGTVPAGTGLLLKGSAGTISIPVGTSAETISTNYLTGVTTNTEVAASTENEHHYVLSTSGETTGFWNLVSAVTIPAGKAYLNTLGTDLTPDPGEARVAWNFNDEATGITTLTNTVYENLYYDLQGRRVAQPTKGLYIVNGKKVILK